MFTFRKLVTLGMAGSLVLCVTACEGGENDTETVTSPSPTPLSTVPYTPVTPTEDYGSADDSYHDYDSGGGLGISVNGNVGLDLGGGVIWTPNGMEFGIGF